MLRHIITSITHPNKDLYRYDKDTNTSHIDIELDFYRELYNEWDFSPITNRDLDQELFEYLEECAEEIPANHKINIVFNVPKTIKNTDKEEKSVQGFANYFNYELRKENNKIRTALHDAALFAVYGALLLFAGTSLIRFLEAHTVYRNVSVLGEGLVIGGWVFTWEVVSIVFFRLKVLLKKKKTLFRLLNADMEFSYRELSDNNLVISNE